jgi:hypothetical protein
MDKQLMSNEVTPAYLILIIMLAYSFGGRNVLKKMHKCIIIKIIIVKMESTLYNWN